MVFVSFHTIGIQNLKVACTYLENMWTHALGHFMFHANCPLYCRNSIRFHSPQICNEHSCWYSTFPDEITPQLCHRNVSQALRFKWIISDYVHKCLRRIWLCFFPHVRDCLLCNTRCRYGQQDCRRPVRFWNILYTFMDYFNIPTPQYSLSHVCQLLSLLGACIKLSISLENFAYRGVLNRSTSDSFMAQILEYPVNEFLDGEKAWLGGLEVLSFSDQKLNVHFLPDHHHHLNFAIFFFIVQ